MPKRESLRRVAARKAEALTAVDQMSGEGQGENVELITVSYNLPVDMVDVLRRLGRQRADAIRAAKKRGEPVEGDARQSASKIVRAILEPHMDEWRRELDD